MNLNSITFVIVVKSGIKKAGKNIIIKTLNRESVKCYRISFYKWTFCSLSLIKQTKYFLLTFEQKSEKKICQIVIFRKTLYELLETDEINEEFIKEELQEKNI